MQHGTPGAVDPADRRASAAGEDAPALYARLSDAASKAFAVIHVLEEVDSTNRWLMARPGCGAGEVCIARAQTAGRGRRGRTWVSPGGGNVYLSAGWHFPQMGERFAGLSLVAGVVAAESIAQLGIQGVGLKWPNDLMCDQGKLGGVLVEASGSAGEGVSAVIGIGINLEPIPGHGRDLDQPVSDLASLGGHPVDGDALAIALIEGLARALPGFEVDGFAPFRARWAALDRLMGLPVRVREGEAVRDGVARGIDETGALQVDSGHGVESVRAADVSVRART